MNWPSEQSTENQLASLGGLAPHRDIPPSALLGSQEPAPESGRRDSAHHPAGPEIKVGRRSTFLGGKDAEVFTMTLGDETIELLPLKTWAQLDLYKWRVRGKLPGTPAGLEITPDHIKLLGQTLSPKDPDACAKLETLFGEWLAMERETLELAKRKAQVKTSSAGQTAAGPAEQQPMHFRVELDKEEQVHILCVQGKETLATIGLTPAGFQSLISQGLMRKPRNLKTGALHDWVELDGVLFSFEKGNNDAAKLELALNANYLPPSSFGKDKEIVIYANAASSTGFDIQFPAKVGGVVDNRRRPLSEESLELLQDNEHCGLVQPKLVIKLSRPSFIFKQKTPDGGERYLEKCSASLVRVRDADGAEKVIDLSQPVNYLRLSAVELTAVFNHPTINRHARANKNEGTPAPSTGIQKQKSGPPPGQPSAAPAAASGSATQVKPAGATPPAPSRSVESAPVSAPLSTLSRPGQPATPAFESKAPPQGREPPNLWLKPILEKQPIRYDWLTSLIYEKIAGWARNSSQGQLMDGGCWFISLTDAEQLDDPDFRGVFLTEKGGFGLLSGGYMIRLEQGTAFVGTPKSELKDSDVRLDAFGIDSEGRLVLIVNDGYRSKFGVPEHTVTATLNELKEHGAELMSIKEVLESPEPLDIVWTAPAEQPNIAELTAVESRRPGFTM